MGTALLGRTLRWLSERPYMACRPSLATCHVFGCLPSRWCLRHRFWRRRPKTVPCVARGRIVPPGATSGPVPPRAARRPVHRTATRRPARPAAFRGALVNLQGPRRKAPRTTPLSPTARQTGRRPTMRPNPTTRRRHTTQRRPTTQRGWARKPRGPSRTGRAWNDAPGRLRPADRIARKSRALWRRGRSRAALSATASARRA